MAISVSDKEKCDKCGDHAPLFKVEIAPNSPIKKFWGGIKEADLCKKCVETVKVVDHIQNNGSDWGETFSDIEEKTGVHRRRIKEIVEKFEFDINDGAKHKRVLSI